MDKSMLAVAGLLASLAGSSAYAVPQYTIVDLGALSATAQSQGNYISPNGQFAAGRSLAVGRYAPITAVTWANGGAAQALSSPTPYANAFAVNNSGVAVGAAYTGYYNTGPSPMSWTGGVGTQLSVPDGYVGGAAYGINSAGIIVGAAGGDVTQIATIWTNGTPTVISATAGDGSYMTTALGITDGGIVVGQGVNPGNAALSVALLYDMNSNTMTELSPSAGNNSALAFSTSASGYTVGSSMLYQGAGTPVIWSPDGVATMIPLPPGAEQATARGVNNAGWAVGIGGGQYAVPFLYDGTHTYDLASLLPANSGWNLDHNTSSGALGITDSGIIIGEGVNIDGNVHAFEMIPSAVPEPATWALMLIGVTVTGGLARRRAAQQRA